MRKYDLIIAIEGIDGAGKTTLANLLKRDFGEEVCIFSRTKKGKLADMLIRSFPLKYMRFLQIPFYLILSYKNYSQCKKNSMARILVMDRCFLSNICYYYPMAMNSKILFKFALLFELRLLPHDIIIIDEDELVAQRRDNMEKDINWLKQTRINYINAQKAIALSNFCITILANNLTIEEKLLFIENIIRDYGG